MLSADRPVTPFRATYEATASRVVVRVGGELDLATAPQLAELLTRVEWDRPVVVDLTGVTFIDSSGIRVLCGAAAQAARRGVAFQAVEASGPVARTLQVAGVAEWLQGSPSSAAG